MCKQKKIDIVLTKSISRFARNTVDCLNYIRALRELGIAVIFEKRNINTLEADSEILITMLGAFAQAESESISANVRWGKRQAMREGKPSFSTTASMPTKRARTEPKIIPEQAEVVRSIYDQYLTGASLRMIKDRLKRNRSPMCQEKLPMDHHNYPQYLAKEKYCEMSFCKNLYQRLYQPKGHPQHGTAPEYVSGPEPSRAGIVERKTFDAWRWSWLRPRRKHDTCRY